MFCNNCGDSHSINQSSILTHLSEHQLYFPNKSGFVGTFELGPWDMQPSTIFEFRTKLVSFDSIGQLVCRAAEGAQAFLKQANTVGKVILPLGSSQWDPLSGNRISEVFFQRTWEYFSESPSSLGVLF